MMQSLARQIPGRDKESNMNSIYTSAGKLVVEQEIWSGVRRLVKNPDGTVEGFYRANGADKFTKTGWGKRAARDFELALRAVRAEIRGA